jgi:hypothetical protein
MKATFNTEIIIKTSIIYIIFMIIDLFIVFIRNKEDPLFANYEFSQDFSAIVIMYLITVIPLSLWIRER